MAIPGWVLGTLAGAISGNLLPDFMMSALSVAIYGMFLAIIIPPAKKNRAVLAVVAAAMVISLLFKVIPLLKNVSSGFVIIITTLIVAGCLFLSCSGRKTKHGSRRGRDYGKGDKSCIIFTSIYW